MQTCAGALLHGAKNRRVQAYRLLDTQPSTLARWMSGAAWVAVKILAVYTLHTDLNAGITDNYLEWIQGTLNTAISVHTLLNIQHHNSAYDAKGNTKQFETQTPSPNAEVLHGIKPARAPPSHSSHASHVPLSEMRLSPRSLSPQPSSSCRSSAVSSPRSAARTPSGMGQA